MNSCLKKLMVALAILLAQALYAPAEVYEFTSPICGPCNQWKPALERLIQAGNDIEPIDITTESGRALARQYGVDRTPTLVAVRDGVEVGRNVGVCSDDQVIALCKKSVSAAKVAGNFLVNVSGPITAEEVRQSAEDWRKKMAVLWIGQELPDWSDPCLVTIKCAENLGAGGTTFFTFTNGEVIKFRSTMQGSKQRLLDSVLPHEITHMVFASYFRQPLPRWADEGAAVTTESSAEQDRYYANLVTCLKSGRGISFDEMFRMTEYPADTMALYSQGYSVASWLINEYGRKKYMEFLSDGLKDDDWQRAIKTCYGFDTSLSMQNAWLAYVKSPSKLNAPASNPVVIAKAPQNANYLSAICSVRVDNGSCGNGALVAPDRVVTAWHLFREPSTGVAVSFGDVHVQGKLLAFDSVNDVAMVALSTPVQIRPLQVNVCGDLPVGRVSIGSYDGQRGFIRATGMAEPGGNSTSPGNPDRCLRVVGVDTVAGDSGGPVLDDSGALVGVHWGCDRPVRSAMACAGRSLQRFLQGVGIAVYCPNTPPQPQVIVRPGPSNDSGIAAVRSELQQYVSDLQQKIDNLSQVKQDRGDYATKGDIPPAVDLTGVSQESEQNRSAIDSLRKEAQDQIAKVRQDASAEIARERDRIETRISETRTDIEGKIPAASGVVVDWGVKSVLVGLGITGGPAALAAWLAAWLVRRRIEKRLDSLHGTEVRGDAPFRRAA